MSEKTSKYKDSCRFCLKHLTSFKLEISDLVRMKFKNTVGIDLRFTEDYPEFHCVECSEELETIYLIKEKFAENQRFLENEMEDNKEHLDLCLHQIFLLPEHTNQYLKTDIKVETENNLSIDNIEVQASSTNRSEYLKSTLESKISKSQNFKYNENLSKNALQNHKKNEHTNILENQKIPNNSDRDDISEVDFEDRLSPNRDIEESSNNPLTACSECGKIVRKKGMSLHINQSHRNVIKGICDVCGKSHHTKRRLREHLLTHFGIKEAECLECNMQFTTKDALSYHRKIHHEKRYHKTCEYCGQSFKNITYYNEHIRSKHTGERPYSCDFEGCGKSFFSKPSLSIHKKRRHSTTLHECLICHKSVKDIKKHKKQHDEKKFKCELIDSSGQVCGKQFSDNTNFQTHMDLVHRGIKKYSCNLCNKFFSVSALLANHKRNIHEKRKIRCELCSSLMSAKRYYVTHILAYHKELDDEAREIILQKIKGTKEEDLFNHQRNIEDEIEAKKKKKKNKKKKAKGE